jgi:hypothetical protein
MAAKINLQTTEPAPNGTNDWGTKRGTTRTSVAQLPRT